MDCTDINNHELLAQYFRQDNKTLLAKVMTCFYEQYFDYVTGTFYQRIFSKWHRIQHIEQELSREAFDEGLLKFYFYIREKGFNDDKATVRTIFMKFCLNKLLQLATEQIRRRKKYELVNNIEISEEKYPSTLPDSTLKDIEEERKEYAKRRKAALTRLDERCINLLMWRKYEKLSNEEIASRMGTMSSGSVNNEVHKCLKRLREHLASINKEN